MWWEGAWPLLWVPIAIILVFLTVSWLGIWLDTPPLARALGLRLFVAALGLSLWPVLRLGRPSRSRALDRVDRDTGLKHGPARTLDDKLALGDADPGSRALWDLHRRRAEAAIEKFKVSAPRPDMPRHDRFALRAAGMLAAVASAFVAGPEVGSRLGAAFDWKPAKVAAPSFRVDGWVDPPLYTRVPPLMIDLAGGPQKLRAPVKSTVVVRVAGQGEVAITPVRGLTPLPVPESQRTDLREQRFTLEDNAELNVRTGIAGGTRLTLEAIPDLPPEISFVGVPEVNARGTFTLIYKGKDDYGITSAEGVVDKGDGFKGRRSLVPAPQITLALPTGAEDEETRTSVDLTNHPWAGARVKLTLLARDEATHEGRSTTIDFVLPQRPFTKPLAKSLVEQRRKLVLDPDDRKRVQIALDSLLIAPDQFTPQWGVFMGLRCRRGPPAAGQDRPGSHGGRRLAVGDGAAARGWRSVRCGAGIARRAGPLARGHGQGRPERGDQAPHRRPPPRMDKFLREFAERMQQQNQQAENQNQRAPDRVITPERPQPHAPADGGCDAARRHGRGAAPARRAAQHPRKPADGAAEQPDDRSAGPRDAGIDAGSRRDDCATSSSFATIRSATARTGGSSRATATGSGKVSASRASASKASVSRASRARDRNRREDKRARRVRTGSRAGRDWASASRRCAIGCRSCSAACAAWACRASRGSSDAEQAMREAENSIGQGQDGQAVDAQGRALEGLQRGMQGMAQQMQNMMQQGDGTEERTASSRATARRQGGRQTGGRNDDPLGRPLRSRDYSDGRVQRARAPTKSASQRAQRILEELRRKLGDPTRPREELDYFERLLSRN